MADIKVIGVLGSGQMGSGIAQLAAVAGISVVLVDSSDSALQKGMQGIRSSLQRFVKKGELTQSPSPLVQHLNITLEKHTLQALKHECPKNMQTEYKWNLFEMFIPSFWKAEE